MTTKNHAPAGWPERGFFVVYGVGLLSVIGRRGVVTPPYGVLSVAIS